MSSEPPVFGENGAVLNSETMTDEWRDEHEAGRQKFTIDFRLKITAFGAFMVAAYFTPRSLLPFLGIGLGLVSIVGSLVPGLRKKPIGERLTLLVLIIPFIADWFYVNGHLGVEGRWLWGMISSALALSLLAIFYLTKRLMADQS